MAKKQKYYAVKEGTKTGIFLTWPECQEAIKGCSKAIFKSFESYEEADAYLNNIDLIYNRDVLPRLEQGRVVAFTDGSYNEKNKSYGAGVCLFAPESSYKELSKKGSNDKYIELNNVAGEILAAIDAINWCIKNGFNKLSIFHDYEGISKWATGAWNANKNFSIFYRKYVNERKDIVDIEFCKVSGHSNNKYNDRADALAKRAIFD